MAAAHLLHHLLFGHVRTPVFDPDPRFQVVEVAAVQLEELDQQHAQVLVGVPGIDAGVELRREQKPKALEMLFFKKKKKNDIQISNKAPAATGSCWRHLQEADDHEDEAVGADPSREDLVQVPLQQELLQHEDQVRQHRVHLEWGDAE